LTSLKAIGLLLAGLILMLTLGGRVAMAQSNEEIQKQIDQLKKETEKIDAEKAKVEAQKALQEAQRALDQATDPKLTELQKQKALADAQKALAEAQTQAALAKYIGDVKAGPYSGSVEMKNNAGTEEALLLASRAVREAGKKVADSVKSKPGPFYIFSVKEFPNFQRLTSFRFRKELLKQAFEAAGVHKPDAHGVELVTPGMVSAGLEAFSKLLGFFKTDYTISGVEAKLDESLLIFSVAGNLSDKEVHVPMLYEPTVQEATIRALTKELAELVFLRGSALTEAKQLKDKVDELEKQAADSKNAASKDDLLKTSSALKPRIDQLNGVIALYDSFAAFLTTPDPNTGLIPLTGVALEFSIQSALKSGGAVLLLRLENTGGGYLLKKNLLTGLWKMPLYHMGGATVTYLLLNGPDGKVLAGDIVPIHGGFVKTDDLRKALDK
jgi:hypothetical protein